MTQTIRWPLIAMMLMAFAWPAYAVDEGKPAETQALVSQAISRFNEGKYQAARNDFMAAFNVTAVPVIAWWSGRAHESLGELVKAAQLYSAAISMQPNELWTNAELQYKAWRDVQQSLKAVLPYIQTLKIELVGGTAVDSRVTVDGANVTGSALGTQLPLEPGAHRVVVIKDDRSLTQQVALAKNESKASTLDLAKATAPESALPSPPARMVPVATPPLSAAGSVVPPPSPVAATPLIPETSTLHVVGWAGLGVGATLLALGTTAGIVAWAKYSSLDDDGCGNGCTEGTVSRDRVISHNGWRNAAKVELIAGGVGVAAGATLLLIKSKRESAPSVGLSVAPNAVGLSEAF